MSKTIKNIKKLKLIELIAIIMAVTLVALYLTNNIAQRRSANNDLEKRKDIDEQYFALNSFFAENGYFPSLEDFNSSTWRSENMPKFSDQFLRNPIGEDNSSYSYVSRQNDKECIETGAKCDSFLVLTELSDDSSYIRKSR